MIEQIKPSLANYSVCCTLTVVKLDLYPASVTTSLTCTNYWHKLQDMQINIDIIELDIIYEKS